MNKLWIKIKNIVNGEGRKEKYAKRMEHLIARYDAIDTEVKTKKTENFQNMKDAVEKMRKSLKRHKK